MVNEERFVVETILIREAQAISIQTSLTENSNKSAAHFMGLYLMFAFTRHSQSLVPGFTLSTYFVGSLD